MSLSLRRTWSSCACPAWATGRCGRCASACTSKPGRTTLERLAGKPARRNGRRKHETLRPEWTEDLRASLAAVQGLRRGPGQAAPTATAAAVGDWLDSLPRQLAANDIRQVRDHLCRAHDEGRTVVAALGGHVIKTGCGPYLIDWIQQGIDQGGGHERGGGHPRLRTGPGRQDQRGRRRQPARPGRFGMARETADAFAVVGPHGGGERNRPRRRPGRLHRRTALPLRRRAAWFWPPTGPASPAPSMSPWAPTSSTCTRTSPGRPWARRR